MRRGRGEEKGKGKLEGRGGRRRGRIEEKGGVRRGRGEVKGER